jgi:hypothetical protein
MPQTCPPLPLLPQMLDTVSLILTLANVALQIIGMLWHLVEVVRRREDVKAVLRAPGGMIGSMRTALRTRNRRGGSIRRGPKKSEWPCLPAAASCILDCCGLWLGLDSASLLVEKSTSPPGFEPRSAGLQPAHPAWGRLGMAPPSRYPPS